MNHLVALLTGMLATGAAIITALMKVWKVGPFLESDATAEDIVVPPTAPVVPQPVVPPPPVPQTPPALLWGTQRDAYHSTRVICDEVGLTIDEKNLICSVIYGESEFYNTARCENKNKAGVVTSIDVGICQINSYFHCGAGKDFPSTDYVIAHPEEAVRWMISMYKHGLLRQWVAYSSGRSAQFLKPNSPMWKLAS